MIIPKELLPWFWYERAFIAGGFAACPSLASDIDVWVPVDAGEKDNIRKVILDHLLTVVPLGAQFVEEDGKGSKRHQIDPKLANSQLLSTFEGYFTTLRLIRAATVHWPGASLPYHIIVVEGDVDEVLSSFDISTHQIALTANGVVKGEHWTSVFEKPVVITQKYTTPERLIKICERYGR